MAAVSITSSAPSYLYYRHTLPVRIMHWTNFIALTVLFMSGLHIFNAHSALYWGDSSYSERPPLLQITARDGANGERIGITNVFGREFETTGVLGLSKYPTADSISTHFHHGRRFRAGIRSHWRATGTSSSRGSSC